MNRHDPIGVFDSGVGGLSVVKQLKEMLPGEGIIYFGDTAHVPYGGKSVEELLVLGEKIISFLTAAGCKTVIAACNTSSAVSVPLLAKRFSVPIISVLEPGAKEAARVTASGRIGVIATSRTVESEAYPRHIRAARPGAKVFQAACPALVPLVESGRLEGPEVEKAVRECLSPLMEQDIDTLVLGCTHYPYLIPVLRRVLPENVAIVDPAHPAVREIGEALAEGGLLNGEKEGECRFYCSGSPQSFYEVAPRMLGWPIREVKVVNID